MRGAVHRRRRSPIKPPMRDPFELWWEKYVMLLMRILNYSMVAYILLLACSQSSLAYPTNTWEDANCLLTVGRVMRAGGVLYRDIYEQKGPTLYLLHMLAAMISDTDFLGVFAMEIVSFAFALTAAHAMIRRRAGEGIAYGLTTLWGACVLVSGAFARGDSAEEFCLPLLMGALALAEGAYGEGRGPMRPGRLFVCGLLAGVVATIKYTVLGLFVGLCAAEGVMALRAGGMRRALRSAGAFLCGMALPVLAWVIDFATNGALGDAYTAYIYNNIFLYQGGGTAGEMLSALARAVRDNATWSLPALLGMALTLLNRRTHAQWRGALLAMALCSLAVVFVLGRTWPYCPLVLCVFAVPLMQRVAPLLDGGGVKNLVVVGAAYALSVGMAIVLNPNAPLRGVSREELAQTRLASYVHEGATVLQYTHLDDGFYLATGTLPVGKYFVRLNVDYDEMREELDRYVREGIPDYVLCSWSALPEAFDNYQLIATDAGYDERGRINKAFYLYRRR